MKMVRYSVTDTLKLRDLCIKNDWFTCGSIEQYDKLFYANEHGCPIEEIATIIWLCSDEECRRSDVLDVLVEAYKEHVMCVIEENGDNEKLLQTPIDELYESYFE